MVTVGEEKERAIGIRWVEVKDAADTLQGIGQPSRNRE